MSRYIPGVFAEAMRESGPASAAHMFDSRHEHPELVWSDEARLRVASRLAELADRSHSISNNTHSIKTSRVVSTDRKTQCRKAFENMELRPAQGRGNAMDTDTTRPVPLASLDGGLCPTVNVSWLI